MCKKDDQHRHYINNEFMGYKWQCVEFARRYLYQNHGIVFPDVIMAYEIFSLRFLRHTETNRRLPLQAFANGSYRPPEKGALLIWSDKGIFKRTGHVAIITEVLPRGVRIAEQNICEDPLPKGQSWTRELPLYQQDNKYYIKDILKDAEILGWMIQTNDDTHSLPFSPLSPDLMEIHSEYIRNQGQFKRCWLNQKNALEKAYIDANGRSMYSSEMYHYCTISKTAEQELMRATNELHLLYLNATDVVLKNDTLLRRFNIPEALWSKIRLSWKKQQTQMITGRLDFCLDERGLKVYEYNADSASCYAETGLILSKWAKKAKLSRGLNAGRNLTNALIASWEHSDAEPFIHIMQDRDKEERYHALFMQRMLKAAGFRTKIIKGVLDLAWNENGNIVDDEGRIIRCVWKTWAWETVLEQFRKNKGLLHEPLTRKNKPRKRVYLMDVLLSPTIHVYEPLWTIIPSNKAILPILWSLYPNHPYLLESTFDLSSHLKKEGYAIKPIAGRQGRNIQLVSTDKQGLDEAKDPLGKQNNIYQQLWCLPKVDSRYIQICTFTVSGHYGGACVRSNSLGVIKGRSDMLPLRVIEDKNFIE